MTAVAVLAAACAAPAAAVTRHVPSEYATIQLGVDAAAAGDTVLVAPGTYTDWETRSGPPTVSAMVFLRNGVSVVSEGGSAVTTLDMLGQGLPGQTEGIHGTSAHSVSLVGFRVTGLPPSSAGAMIRSTQSLEVRDCVFDSLDSTSPGAVLYLLDSVADVRECRFVDCIGTGLRSWDSNILVEDCTFERCSRSAQADVSHAGFEAIFRRCRFLGNIGESRSGLYAYGRAITVEDCRFEGNRSDGDLVASVGVRYGSATIEGNVFVDNSATSNAGLALDIDSGFGIVRNNTFQGSTVNFEFRGASLYVDLDDHTDSVVIENNIFAGSRGSQAVSAYGLRVQSACNVFWDNPLGHTTTQPSYPWSASDFVIDPRFCDVAGGDVSVRANSPCLPENHPADCPGPIGALGAECPADGAVILGITATPGGPSVIVDGVADIAPTLVASMPGALHTLDADSIHVDGGTRHVFDSWSDSGARVHEIAMPPGYAEFEARFDTEHFLTVRTDSGGTVEASSWIAEDAEHWITAVPDSGYSFYWWIGDGDGHYSGPENPARLEVREPLTQTAYFLPDGYPLVTGADGGTVTPPTGSQPRGATVEITATPDEGFLFTGWIGEGAGSYTGSDNPAAVVMESPITQTATFATTLEMTAGPGGAVTPATATFPASSVVEIEAVPDAHSVFTGWKGEGQGSYTGTDNPATVTMNGPITQVARFERLAFALTLSLSDTDPHVHTGPPIGFGNVYLWLDCGTLGGITGLQAAVAGTMSPVAFQPAPGILSSGTPAHLDLAMLSCVTGPALLGTFTVLPPGEGELCLATSAAFPEMAVTDCGTPAARFTWPQDVRVTGVRTDGGIPCGAGRGCGEPLPAIAAVSTPPPPVPAAYADALLGGSPNPFGGSTRIGFTLSRRGRASLTVYDVAGRTVRRLVDGDHPPGRHEVTWSGRNAAGQVVPSGIYFVCMETRDHRQTRKLVHLAR